MRPVKEVVLVLSGKMSDGNVCWDNNGQLFVCDPNAWTRVRYKLSDMSESLFVLIMGCMAGRVALTNYCLCSMVVMVDGYKWRSRVIPDLS